jgi:negative regulator of sigma E activity
MTDSDEKLSYLLDEYSASDGRAEIDEVLGDVNLQYRARRYRMIGEVMRGELPAAVDTGFHGSVMARIEAEAASRPVDAEPGARDTRGSIFDRALFKPIAGFAVAATVALVTVVLWQPLERLTGQAGDALVEADQQKVERLAGQQPRGDVVTASTSLQPVGTRWKIDGEMPGLQEKLNAYLVNHTEYSNSVQGLIPQARVAGFDAQR